MAKEVKIGGIILPTMPIQATAVNPESLVLFGLPKCGKTRAIMDQESGLKNCLLIDVEKGSNHYTGLKLQPPEEYGAVRTFSWLKELATTIKDSGKPYDYVAIDTLSYLDELAETVGTWNYMNSVQGKNFNIAKNADGEIIKDKDGKSRKIFPTEPGFESVHTLPEGYGYRWSREALLDIFKHLKGLGKICTIFICHVADKYIVSKERNQEVRVIDLSLTGKVRNIVSRDVDAIGYVWNEEGTMHISFKGNEERVGGIRGSEHIQGYEGPLEWDKIFV